MGEEGKGEGGAMLGQEVEMKNLSGFGLGGLDGPDDYHAGQPDPYDISKIKKKEKVGLSISFSTGY